MIEGIPCEFCILDCNFISMVYCEKLIIWIKLDRDNEEKDKTPIKEEASKEISSTNS